MIQALEKFRGKKVHILGVAGTLMGAFAAFLKRNGIDVTGSDQNIYPPMSDVLKNSGIEVFAPFAPENISKRAPDLVIVGNVIRKTNPEMMAVQEQGIEYFSLPSALEKMILPQKHPVVVAGTHGKTTTSGLLSYILEVCGEKPSFFVGGVLKDFPESFRITDSKYMVLEGDEYDTAFFDKVPKFTHYLPQDTILTSVEYDHADIYPDMKSVIRAFDELAKLTSPEGYFIVCGEAETALRVSLRTDAHVVHYGFGEQMESFAEKLEMDQKSTRFKWNFNPPKQHPEQYKVELSLPGKHNALNAIACLTWARLRGLPMEKVLLALKNFQSVKRRQEVFATTPSGTVLIDDFAHHPTAVRETLASIRGKYPSARIVACFEPRSATSRRKIFQSAYAESFDAADLVYIAKPYDQTQIQSDDLFSTEDLIADLKKAGKSASVLQTNPNGIKALAKSINPGDVVLVMSNGGFDGLLPKLRDQLQSK